MFWFKKFLQRCKKGDGGNHNAPNPLPVTEVEFNKHFGELCRPVSFFMENRGDDGVAVGWIFEDSNHRRTFVPALQVLKNFSDLHEFFHSRKTEATKHQNSGQEN